MASSNVMQFRVAQAKMHSKWEPLIHFNQNRYQFAQVLIYSEIMNEYSNFISRTLIT